MRVLIQNCDDYRYLTENFDWTGNPVEARAFETSAHALNLCLARHLENVQIVLKFPRGDLDVHLPLKDSGCKNN